MKKRIILLILCVAIAACLGVSSAVGAFAYDTTIEEWGVEHFNQLDVGLFWYTEKDQRIPVADYTVDTTKPTIIYTHGWKPYDSHFRECLSLKDDTDPAITKKGFKTYEDEGYDPEFCNYYLERGYNVGVYFWNQLSGDESMTTDSKIWWSDGGKNMTYATFPSVDSTGKDRVISSPDDPKNPKKSVALLYADALIEALGEEYDKDLHLVGHSMGGQLTLATTEALCLMKDEGKLSGAFLPDRLTVIDPYFNFLTSVTGVIDHTGEFVSKKSAAYLSAKAAETCANHAIPIEGFGANEDAVFRNYLYGVKLLAKAAEANGEDPSEVKGMKEANEITRLFGDNIAWVYMKPLVGSKGYGGFAPTHVMSVDYYFTTNYMEPVLSEEGLQVPSAKMTNEELKSVIGRCFVQQIPDTRAENPLYYNSGTFRLENFYSLYISPYTEEDGVGYLSGKIEVERRNNKDVEVKLVNEDGKVVSEATVNEDGYYHFSNVNAGKYSVKIYADTIKVDEIEDVNVVKGSYKTVEIETKEIVMGGDKLLLYSVIALCAVLVIVCLVGLIKVIVTAAKRRAK